MVLACTLVACGTISRTVGPATVPSWPAPTYGDSRRSPDDPRQAEIASEEIGQRLAVSGRPLNILVLSGGGASGAFGAGEIVGWTQRGDRPEFDIVTGVSTGALAAPFAFLGSQWDDQLRAAYTSDRTKSLMRWRLRWALFSPSLFSSADLRDLINENVTPSLLKAIAVEHAKGRRLFVATTNLDTEDMVVWDMGALASKGNGEALQLFRTVLLASASIPGVYPPVMIRGLSAEGKPITEMHVDGGVNAPFLGVPESAMLLMGATPRGNGGAIYVLVNGKLERDVRITGGSLRAIVERSYDSASKASIRTQLAVNAKFAAMHGMALYVSAIPQDLESSSLDFAPESMRRLFEAGRARGAAGQAWQEVTQTPFTPATIEGSQEPPKP